jgi:hypothetical protein
MEGVLGSRWLNHLSMQCMPLRPLTLSKCAMTGQAPPSPTALDNSQPCARGPTPNHEVRCFTLAAHSTVTARDRTFTQHAEWQGTASSKPTPLLRPTRPPFSSRGNRGAYNSYILWHPSHSAHRCSLHNSFRGVFRYGLVIKTGFKSPQQLVSAFGC